MPSFNLPNMGGPTLSVKLIKTMILELKNGRFKDCDRLPSETELAEQFGVSRSVIRDVMSILEQKGFVERVRGIGTTIHRDIVNLENRLDLKYEYYELIQNAGYRPSCDQVRRYTLPAAPEIAAKLGVEQGKTVICCEKRVLASGTPVIYSYDYLSETIFSNTDYKQLDWAEPVFHILEEHCGVTVDVSVAKLMATTGTPQAREMLGTGENEALFLLDEVSYYKLSRPIIQTHAYYTNFFGFTMLRKKL